MTNITVVFDPEYCDSFIQIKPSKNHDDSQYHINASLTLKKEMKIMMIYAQASRNPVGKPNEINKFYDSTINVCKMFQKRNAADVIANFVLDLLRKFGPVPRSCPIVAVRSV